MLFPEGSFMSLHDSSMGKRLFDIMVAFLAMIMFSPLFVSIAILVKLGSPGPVLYRGVRTKQYGGPFHMLKFRTMVENAEALGGPSTALHDPRLTKVGTFLRKYKLDEMPQLLNILKGEMSIVGPRPQLIEFTDRYSGEEKIILNARPGLIDYATVEFFHLDKILGDKDVDEKYLHEVEPRKNFLRVKYVKEQSFRTDAKILWLAIWKLLLTSRLWNTKD